MRRRILVLAAAWTLAANGMVRATEWVADFTGSGPTGWQNSDYTSVYHYTDTGGLNPFSYTVTFPTSSTSGDISNLTAGWLTQGTRAALPTTAKFTNPAGDGKNGRMRFATPIPASMDGNGGVAFAWTARYGSYSMNRAPIQLAIYDTGTSGGGVPYSAYVRVQGGVTVAILNNNGGGYAGISALTIPNIADSQYHQWSCSIITSGGMAYWKLWLDGTLLIFAGADGGPSFDPGTGPEQFSFRTATNSFSVLPTSTTGAYIGLGELQSSDTWDFEFDCIAFRDSGLAQLTCGSSAPPCDSSVTPSVTQTATALKGSAATPSSFVYTFANTGSGANGYTVAESTAGGTPQDYTWLSLDKSGNASVPPLGGNDQVTATITDTNMAAGTYTAYVTFTHSCTPAVSYTRRIDLVITDCAFAVTPGGEVARSVTIGSVDSVADAVFVVSNTGTDGLTYSVVKEGSDTAWVTLDKSGGGPLNSAATDTVHASINPTGVSQGLHTCTLRFTNTKAGCSNSPPDILRTVVLNVLGTSSGIEQFNAEFTEFTGTDDTSLSPMSSCDPNVATTRQFFVPQGASLQVDQLDPAWLTQGSISGMPTTAKFNNPAGPSGVGTGVGRARFQTYLPLGASYDPVKGMAVAWNMRVGNYSPTRGPIQITFPRVSGPYGQDATLDIPGDVFNAYIRIQNGNRVAILRNGGAQFSGINTLTLPVSIADEYHQWTAAVCYQASDQRAYWNLWIDGVKLLFTGSNVDGSEGSTIGPGGAVYSFRTFLEDVGGDPFIGLGEQQTSIDIWDFDFDWVRVLSYNVTGCPFWNGEGCVPAPLCNTPWADADGDHDVDSDDFAVFQKCYTGPGSFALSQACQCFDRNHLHNVDNLDFGFFQLCSTRAGIPWQSTVDCP